jgi:FAD/FMN-containing dehydrogenase
MLVSGWGNYPRVEASVCFADSILKAHSCLNQSDEFIPRGLGRSYGDSSLNSSIVSTVRLNRFLRFDSKAGLVRCEAGVPLKDVLDVVVPHGWFLPVAPGTKHVTVGGAIASDVHGKNHHREGTFSEHVTSLELLLPDGMVVNCSKEESPELFRAVCGGMGLVGLILSAEFRLKRIETAYIRQETVRAKCLDEIIELFDKYKDWTYSVAWIDCLKGGNEMGRSVLMLGEHALKEELMGLAAYSEMLSVRAKRVLTMPFNFPSFFLNSIVVRSFNAYYYRKHRDGRGSGVVDYDTFFYPLDGIGDWNRIYGSRGFTQYQVVLPMEGSPEGLKKMLTEIRRSGGGSFLAVLKLFGRENENYLSFPMEGFTLALDFPMRPGLLDLLKKLDRITLEYGGRLYLTKDARMEREMFLKGYPDAGKFIAMKHNVDRDNKLQSLQSKRLGI